MIVVSQGTIVILFFEIKNYLNLLSKIFANSEKVRIFAGRLLSKYVSV